jgi:hypothetical protein
LESGLFSGQSGLRDRPSANRPVAIDPACVKTRTSGEGAELFSPFAAFDGDCQCCCSSIQRNLDKISMRKFDVEVFTQAGPTPDLKFDFRMTKERLAGRLAFG